MSYEYERGFYGLGTNGKELPERPPLPSGRLTQEQLDEHIRATREWQEAYVQSAVDEQTAATQRTREWVQTPAATVGLCALGSLPFGAALGAIASPKGERGGGARWGIMASLATCPLAPLLNSLGIFGQVINISISWGAPIVAARYRLKLKAERRQIRNGRKMHYRKGAARWAGQLPEARKEPSVFSGSMGGMRHMVKAREWKQAFIDAYIEQWGHDPVKEGHHPREFYELMDRGMSPKDAAEKFGRYHEAY
jgi:hypothetical protein